MRNLYISLFRGHYARLVKRGRSNDDALSDACYLVSVASWTNLISIVLLIGVKFSPDRLQLSILGVLSAYLVYLGHKKLVAAWRNQIEEVAIASPRSIGGVSENVASWIHLLGSILLLFAIILFRSMLD